MKLGIIGLPQSGKFTIYSALTGARGLSSAERTKKGDRLVGTVNVADERVDKLKEIYKPDKTVYSQIEYILPGTIADSDHGKRERENAMLTAVRTCDGLIHVVRNFQLFGGPPPTPEEDFLKLESEVILSDLMVAELKIMAQSNTAEGRADSDKLAELQEVLEKVGAFVQQMRVQPEKRRAMTASADTCMERALEALRAQAALRAFPDVAAAHLGIPEDEQILCGLSFGYEDPEVPANQTRQPRDSVSSNVFFRD